MSVGETTLSGCSLVPATARIRPQARPSCWPGRLVAPEVMFNDALRARQDAHAAGERVSDTQVQRKVVTLAKTTPARQWLGGVASVALVQACQDARRGTGTGSTPCPVRVRAARLGTHGSGPVRTTGPGSRAPDMVFIASSLSAGWPACLSLLELSLCPLCVIINVVFHSSIGVGDDGDHDGSTTPDSGARGRDRDRTGRLFGAGRGRWAGLRPR